MDLLVQPSTTPQEAAFSAPVSVGGLALRRFGVTRPLWATGSATPVLLLHGWCADAVTNWSRALPALEGLTVFAVDLPGHGTSPPPPDRFSIAGCAAAVAETLDELGGPPVVVVGYSMGGPVSQYLARERPDLVAGLVEIATAARIMPSVLTRTVAPAAAQAGRLLAEAAATASRILRAGDDLRGHALGMLRSSDKTSLARAAGALARYDARPWLAELSVPSAVAITARDRAVPPAAQREMADLLGTAHQARLEVPLGHLACLDASFGSVVRAALTAVDPESFALDAPDQAPRRSRARALGR